MHSTEHRHATANTDEVDWMLLLLTLLNPSQSGDHPARQRESDYSRRYPKLAVLPCQ